MRVLVTGATSMIGDYLLPILVKAGHQVVATSRKAHAAQENVEWIQGDLKSDEWMRGVGKIDVWINFAALTLLPPLLRAAAEHMQVGRLIAFSSTSRYTKSDARGAIDRTFAETLAEGEKSIEAICGELGVGWTIFRPTLIYSLGRDKNITLISNKIRQLHFFPLIGSGKGLRQPVRAEDLATACVQAMNCQASVNKAYNLSGSEVLSYREMVERLFSKQGMKPRFVRVPLALFRLAFRVLSLLPRYRYLNPDMADRMERDMVFSHEEATRDFGYLPQRFQP